jgi:CheY-like chemotaxis protein
VALAELRETLRQNETFAGVLAHDLRNPLGAIMTAAQLMIRRLGTGSDSTKSPLRRIVSSGERMNRLISQLLDFTRARMGNGFELALREADLLQICEQAIGELQLAHADRRIHVVSLGELAGTWDADRLVQAVSNLVANAGQHGRTGGDITVKLDGAQPEQVVLEVHNEGTIPAALLPELFLPFRGRRERNPGGLGLGLFITREIVRGHGGSIEARSSEAGTLFTVRLPRHPIASPARAGGPSDGTEPTRPRGPILLVEDDVDVREGLADALRDLGFEVVTAVNGRDALNLLVERKVAPAVILLDLMMPVMDGYRFLEELRKHDGLAGIPIAVVTAGHGVDGARLGEVPIIPKPIKLPQLKRTLERLCGGSTGA